LRTDVDTFLKETNEIGVIKMTDVTNGAYNWLTTMIEDQYGFTTDLYKMMFDDKSMD